MTTYYPSCNSSTQSIVDGLKQIGVDSSKENREKIANLNDISNYSGSGEQNNTLLNLLKNGKLIKSKGITYYPSCDSSTQSIVDGLKQIGVDSSKENREKIANLNGILNYTGSGEQNNTLLNFLKKGKLIKSKDDTSSHLSNEDMIKNIEKSGQFDKKTNAMGIIGRLLFNNGCEKTFVAGILANIYHEGDFGYFESSKYVKNPERKPNYLKIMDENYDYANKYSGKIVTEVNLKELKVLSDKLKNDKWEKGKFGLGTIQWTGERTGPLVDLYVEEAKGAEKISLNQVIAAEGKLIIKELKSNYSYIHETWKKNHENNLCSEQAAYDAAYLICQKYEVPFDKAQYEIRANTGKKVFKIMMDN